MKLNSPAALLEHFRISANRKNALSCCFAAMRKSAHIFTGIALFTGLLCAAATAQAEELPSFVLEMNDGVLTPERIEIPANTQVKIILRNTGTTPAEFESLRLRKEKVLAPGAESFVVIRKVSPGEYPFFDEFHMDTANGVIVAR